MKSMKQLKYFGLVVLTALAFAPAAMAQEDQWDINGDVDNDGQVGPTDIQHVINDALGLNDQGTEAVNRPLRHYIVASPRISLAPRPGVEPGSEEPCNIIGSATNFQRDNGRLIVRKDTAIAFRFDRNMEGVWHENACGLLRTSLTVEVRPVIEPEPAAGAVEGEGEGEGELPEPEWRLVGVDDAAGRVCGPAIGTAEIAVRTRFEHPGLFMVRCTIRSAAIPEGEIAEPGNEPVLCGGKRDMDVVMTLVRVVDREAIEEDLQWQFENDPPTVGSRFGNPLDDVVDETLPQP